jgi:ABC-type sugar transport system substrate-binding protein
MRTTMIRVCLALALMAAAVGSRNAVAQDFLNQGWVLNPSLSNVYMQTIKRPSSSVVESEARRKKH